VLGYAFTLFIPESVKVTSLLTNKSP